MYIFMYLYMYIYISIPYWYSLYIYIYTFYINNEIYNSIFALPTCITKHTCVRSKQNDEAQQSAPFQPCHINIHYHRGIGRAI